MRIGIVGSGIAGLVSAHLLAPDHDVTIFEADVRLGGHTNTVTVEVGGVVHDVDTGFIVYNERNYPTFTRLLARLDVATQASEMSFSVVDRPSGTEWAGTSLDGVFAQRSNLTNRRFLRMLLDIARFGRVARAQLQRPDDPSLTLAELLARHSWSEEFVDCYLIPLGAAIWSADPSKFTEYPASTFLRFCDNHGLITYVDRPAWRTVTGGSLRYVEALTAPLTDAIRLDSPVESVQRFDDRVDLVARGTVHSFDHVVIATHSDQALHMLADPTLAEREVLAAIRYQPNRATLHTDASVMPTSKRAWASWNYQRRSAADTQATLTYDMNRLQSIDSTQPLLVTLNSVDRIDPAKVLGEFDYAHPIYDEAAVRAQSRHRELCTNRTSFCGAYWGYGFHEDGASSGLRVANWLDSSW